MGIFDAISEGFKIWEVISGWVAAGGVIFLAAVAIAVFLPALRLPAIIVAVCAVYSTVIMTKGVHLGRELEKARCDAAEARAEKAATARDDTQGEVAGTDAAAKIALLAEQAKQDKETINALRAGDKTCHPVTPQQLR